MHPRPHDAPWRRRRKAMQRTASFICAMIATLMCMLSPRSPHGSSLLPLLLCPVAAQQHAPFAVDTSSNRLAFLEQNLADNEDNDDDDHNHNRTARAMTLIADYTWQINVTLKANTSFVLVNLKQDGTPDWPTQLGRGSDPDRLEIGGDNILAQSRGRYTLTYFTPSFAQSRLPLLLDGAPSAFWMVRVSTQLWTSLIINSTSFVAVQSPIVVHLYFGRAIDPAALSANFSSIVLCEGNVKWANASSLVAHTDSHYSFEITPFEAQEDSAASAGDVISVAVPEGVVFAGNSTDDEAEEDAPNLAARFSLIYSPRARRRGTPYWHPLIFLRNSAAGSAELGGWVTALHANLVASTGQVLLTGWEREQELSCGPSPGDGLRQTGVSFLLNPAELDSLETEAVAHGLPLLNLTLPIVALDEAPINATDALYCSGHAPLRDGRKLFVGGSAMVFDPAADAAAATAVESGLDYARIWDPLSFNFSVLSNDPMLPFGQAWHPSLARLADGRVLMAGGFRDATCAAQQPSGAACFNPALALFNTSALDTGASGWQWILPASASDATINPDAEDYTRVWVLGSPVFAGGRWRTVAMMGSAGITVLVDVEASTPDDERFFRPTNGTRPTHAAAAAAASACNNGSTSVVVSTGELLTVGGCGSSWLDLYNPLTDSWRSLDTGIPRDFASALLLPDGTVLLLNGENPALNQTDAHETGQTREGDPRYFQIFDPLALRVETYPETEESQSAGSGSFNSSRLAPFRGLHNTAALLRDGRVLITGGVQRGDGGSCEQPNLRLLSPPYFRPFPVSATAAATNHTDTNLTAASLSDAAPMLLPSRPAFDVSLMLNSSWGSPFNASEFAAQFLNASYAPLFLRVNTTAQLAVRLVTADVNASTSAYAADLSLRNEPQLSPLLHAGSQWDSGLSFGGGGLVLLALQSSTHGFDGNQRYVSLQYADAESNGTVSWGAGAAGENATAAIPTERSVVVRVVLPPAPILNPGEYLLFALSASGIPSVALHTRVLSASEDASTAYSYSSPSGSRSPSGGLPFYPITPGDGRSSDASPWDRQNILLMAFLGGTGVLFFLGLALWFWRKLRRDALRSDMSHATRTPAALRMHSMGQAAHQQGFDPLA